MRYNPKRSKKGEIMLNLACGTITSPDWNNLDFSLYAKLRKHSIIVKILYLIGILSQQRYETLIKIDKDIICWDLRKGIPFNDNVFDCIYCAQFIEHLDREKLPFFLNECYRVLHKGGIIRIVTPNLEYGVSKYLNIIKKIKNDFNNNFFWQQYDSVMDEIFEQMVRKESFGTSKQNLLVKIIERIFKGDAIKSGEIHRWLYDYFSLRRILEKIGFKNVKKKKHNESDIPNFSNYSFEESYQDKDEDKNLFIEAVK